MKKNASGYYEKRIDIGRDPITGNRIRKAIRAKTIRELDQKVFAYKQEMKSRADIPDDDITFGAYAKRWMLTKAGRSINTRNMYQDILNRYILPELKDLYFSEINLELLQQIIIDNFDHPNTCGKIRLLLRQIYDMAADEHLANTNINFKRLAMPAKKVVTPKRALTNEEKAAIRLADLTDMERAFVYVLYYTGIRREEALALLPSDFDFTKKTVSINKTLVFDDNTAVLMEGMAKNKYSIRTLPVPDAAIPFLKEYCDKCDGHLFHQLKGDKGLMSKASYMKFWRRIQSALLPYAPSARTLTAHLFRHNYATMLYYSNVSIKKAAELMGHADTTMIMKIYAHLDELKEQVADKLNAIFS